MKKILRFILTPFLLVVLSTSIYASDGPSILVNNKKLSMSAVNKEARVLVPLRPIFEALDAKVDYHERTRTIIAQREKDTILLKADSEIASVNGKTVKLDVPATNIYDRTFVPVRFVSESLGAQVRWDNINKTVVINMGKKDPDVETLTGFIVIRDNIVYFDQVEIVDAANRKRLRELGLDDRDIPGKYIIVNKEREKRLLKLADRVEYRFNDLYRNFIDEVERDIRYITNKQEEFLKHLGEYNLNDLPLFEQTIPYIIRIKDGEIISIEEKLEYTI